MVDRIKITTNNITCRNASNQVTFNTNNQYLKSDPNGVFKAGGVLQAPIVYGQGLAADMNYGPLRSGYPITRNYSVGQSHTTNGARVVGNNLFLTGRKNVNLYENIIREIDTVTWFAYAVTTPQATNYKGYNFYYDGAYQSTNLYYVPIIIYGRTYGGQQVYRYWTVFPAGIPLADGKTIQIVAADLDDSYWYDFGNSTDRTNTVQSLNSLYWAGNVDSYVYGSPVSFGLEVV